MSQLEFEESALEANAISKNFKHKGSPRVLVVCGSAIRAAELTRRLRPISKRQVAKLFSKHIKIEEQKKLLEGNAVDIGVGTPNRILKLIESGHLRITQLRLILVDCTKDQKMRMVIDMDETREDLYTLWKNHLAKLVCESAPSPESEQDGAKRGVRLRLFETSY
ncbi:hypothetical protein EV182_003210 [Spiromyces aspiralis]|uniref:Uncharacterized protein n=1 Tax=Spiromyces aspiralis TaxID=68401 RepID=A0ACC1HGL6_9FUNG|nr:hypothetical protein EV182_003210 [Spiromyces aspiralis]